MADSDKYPAVDTAATSSDRQMQHDLDNPTNLREDAIVYSLIDLVLARKMALVNAAIDEIGMTPFQWKLFFMNGFGYAADSLLVVCQNISQVAVNQEYRSADAKLQGVSLASQIGLLVGAAAWGFTADVIGRKLAFNSSLFASAIFVLIAGAMPSYVSFSAMVAIYSAGAGGNYILDATNFLEFLPTTHSWLVTALALWWAVGYTIAGLFAWAFMSNFSCDPDATMETCHRSQNMGWRYLHFTCGGLVIVMSIVRVLFLRMVQTPKWLVSQNRDDEAYQILVNLSEKYNRPFNLTVAQLQSQGRVINSEKSAWSKVRLVSHFSGLFSSRRLGYSTAVISLNWLLIGTVSPLYSLFLPFYLKTQGAKAGDDSNYMTWRNYAIIQVAGLFGPAIAGFLVQTRWFGRRGTLAIGAAITTVLQLGYTQIKTPAQNLGLSAAISAATNIYYSTIYAYTPEILPAAHRATGYAVCVVLNRVGGIVGVLVGSYANVDTVAPLFICAGLYGGLVITSLLLPFESRGKGTV
ncbi:hypothetical protein AnigIFM56816_005265 [Aspergillus niger]|nr:hypothetical protein AnigIFM56816_005265 [Aspergillus niger]